MERSLFNRHHPAKQPKKAFQLLKDRTRYTRASIEAINRVGQQSCNLSTIGLPLKLIKANNFIKEEQTVITLWSISVL